jgi:EAL domain-containing protein (putative c-di-GMP-specific phosphodiesterase class I)
MEVLVTRNTPAGGPAPRRARTRHPLPLSEIQSALTGAMFEARYQPIVRLSDRTPVAVEILARLKHPTRGMVLPHRFVPQIEAAGLGPQLTANVAQRAFSDMAELTMAPHRLDLAVNLPLDVLLMPNALAMLSTQHRQQGIPASQIIIELTESMPVQDVPALRAATQGLRDAGYQVMIDDVEPTVPSLDALLDVPFSGIKLDKSIVGRVVTDSAAHAFTARMVGAARSRGLTVTAEGVEDAATWDRLVALGVDLAQGFLIARPLGAAAVQPWLRRWSQDGPRQ